MWASLDSGVAKQRVQLWHEKDAGGVLLFFSAIEFEAFGPFECDLRIEVLTGIRNFLRARQSLS